MWRHGHARTIIFPWPPSLRQDLSSAILKSVHQNSIYKIFPQRPEKLPPPYSFPLSQFNTQNSLFTNQFSTSLNESTPVLTQYIFILSQTYKHIKLCSLYSLFIRTTSACAFLYFLLFYIIQFLPLTNSVSTTSLVHKTRLPSLTVIKIRKLKLL